MAAALRAEPRAYDLLLRAVTTTALGALVAIAIGAVMSAVIGQVAPAMRVTGEILARTQPLAPLAGLAVATGYAGLAGFTTSPRRGRWWQHSVTPPVG